MTPSATSGYSLSPFLLITISFLITSAAFTITTAAEAIMEHEVDGAIDALRVNNYRGHESKPWFSMTRPIRYMLREQRLVFVLVGIAITTLVFVLLPSSSSAPFTLLSPHNSDLFRLGMSSATAADFIQSSHSIFFRCLQTRGFDLDFKLAQDSTISLHRYGQYLYGGLFIFSPSVERFGGSINQAVILEFVDSGRDLILAADASASELIREIATDCGIDFDEVSTAAPMLPPLAAASESICEDRPKMM